MSYDGQTLLRVANAAMPHAALYHKFASGSPASCSSPTSTQPPVDAFCHSSPWHSSHVGYHPTQPVPLLYMPCGVEMHFIGDLLGKISCP